MLQLFVIKKKLAINYIIGSSYDSNLISGKYYILTKNKILVKSEEYRYNLKYNG